jgi:hypothetical protein
MIAISADLHPSILVICYVFVLEPPLYHASFSFYGAYIACTFSSTYVPFHQMIKQKESIIGSKGLVAVFLYVGYFFIFILTITLGIATTVTLSQMDRLSDGRFSVDSINSRALQHIALLLILISIVLFCLVHKKLIKSHRLLFFFFFFFFGIYRPYSHGSDHQVFFGGI